MHTFASMVRIHNIKLTRDKLTLVQAFKHVTNLGLKESLDAVNQMVANGESILHDFQAEKLKDFIDFESETIEEADPWTDYRKPKEPDEETKKALEWFEAQEPETKRMIELVGAWINQPLIAFG